MTHKYLPEPYCDFWTMRRHLYFHLYPEPRDDGELLAALTDARASADAAIAARAEHLQGLGRDPSDAKNHDVAHAHGALSVRDLPKGASEIFERAKDADVVIRLSQRIESGSYNPVESLFPYMYRDRPQYRPPYVFRVISRRRWDDFRTAAKDALYNGRIAAFYKNKDGIHQVDKCSIWLDDEIANRALERGVVKDADIRRRNNTGAWIELLFDKRQLAKEFPTKAAQTVAAGDVINQVVAALGAEYPEGIPKDGHGYVGRAQKRIENILGFRIGRTTFHDARKLAYGEAEGEG
ncbi:MAG: hypothetical protein AB3N15_10605 [Paracoccaceae bacterium]